MTRIGICEDDAVRTPRAHRASRDDGHEAVHGPQRSGGDLRILGPRQRRRARDRHRSPGRRRPRRLPGAPGRRQHAPVLFLTALDAVHDRIVGVQRRRRRLRREAVLGPRGAGPDQRAAQAHPARAGSRSPGSGSTRTASRRASTAREEKLTPTEFRLLAALAATPGDVVRRRALWRRVARRGDGLREHPRLLRPPAAGQARAGRLAGAPGDGARRRVRPRSEGAHPARRRTRPLRSAPRIVWTTARRHGGRDGP